MKISDGNVENYSFLVLLKPEGHISKALEDALKKMIKQHFQIHQVSMIRTKSLDGNKMRAMGALNWVYPRLASIAEFGSDALTADERKDIHSIAGGKRVLSAVDALSELDFSEAELCAKGDKSVVVKLGPGAYVAYMAQHDIVVLNHFFPEFCERFYANNAIVTAFECSASQNGLHSLRDKLIGHIDPSKASVGSLRASVFSQASRLDIEVSTAKNFFHISPGYLEAAFQLGNLFSEGGGFIDRVRSEGIPILAQYESFLSDNKNISNLFASSEPLLKLDALNLLNPFTVCL